jgi:UDP-3-O-[3-hydroxymyristoyl] N-acetylglucosamine deacetylase
MPTVANPVMSGIGLITGLPVSATLKPAKTLGQGIMFYRHGHTSPIVATLGALASTDRSVTLANAQGQTLSIVEHFLAACALSGITDLTVHLDGPAPELPILDGSADLWYQALAPFADPNALSVAPDITLPAPIVIHSSKGSILALPADDFLVHYAVDFDHPALARRFVRWQPQGASASGGDNPLAILGARTFGAVTDLPALQARGLAMGANETNTLGLTQDGGFTDALRFEDEPIKHKIVDLLGDLMLTGFNPLRLKAHIMVYKGGHTLHTQLAKQLLANITPIGGNS